MPNRVALLRAELEAAHPDARLKHRGECGFSYVLADGSEEHRYTTGPWHWQAPGDSDWREIDTDLETRAGTFSRGVKSARFDTTVAPNGRRRFYPRRWIQDEYCEFGVLQWNTTGTTWATVTLGTAAAKQGCPNVLAYSRTTHAYEIGFNGRGCRTQLTLKSASVARSIRWPVTLVGLTLKDGVLVSVKDSEQVGFLRPPSWSDASENPEPKPIPWKYENGYVTLTPDFTGAVFPVVVDPDYSITAGADDGYTWYNSWTADGTFICTGSLYYNSWFRFPGISASQGQDCTAATIKLVCAISQTDDILSDLYGVDEANHVAPTSRAEWATDHGTHTAATTAWDFTTNWTAGTQYTTPDISAIIDELLGIAQWQTGNAIGIHWDTASAVNQEQYAAAYENTSYTEPVLSLTLAAASQDEEGTAAFAAIAGFTVTGEEANARYDDAATSMTAASAGDGSTQRAGTGDIP